MFRKSKKPTRGKRVRKVVNNNVNKVTVKVNSDNVAGESKGRGSPAGTAGRNMLGRSDSVAMYAQPPSNQSALPSGNLNMEVERLKRDIDSLKNASYPVTSSSLNIPSKPSNEMNGSFMDFVRKRGLETPPQEPEYEDIVKGLPNRYGEEGDENEEKSKRTRVPNPKFPGLGLNTPPKRIKRVGGYHEEGENVIYEGQGDIPRFNIYKNASHRLYIAEGDSLEKYVPKAEVERWKPEVYGPKKKKK
jgi:hypothetical protein